MYRYTGVGYLPHAYWRRRVELVIVAMVGSGQYTASVGYLPQYADDWKERGDWSVYRL